MTQRKPLLFAVLVSPILFLAPSNAMAQEETVHFFDQHVAPILITKCLSCHGTDRNGELDLRTADAAIAGGESGPALAPGNPAESLLYQHVTTEEMPPDDPLSKEQAAVLKKWITAGAYYPEQPLDLFSLSTDLRAGYDWWSLRPLSKPDLPVVDDAPASWQERPIDRFVAAKLQAENLTPSEPASPTTLIRRASYDLTGLPPSPAEVQAFVDACRQETGADRKVGQKAYTDLLDRLLASPRYGERWGRHWLDVVRFGESNGYERNAIVSNVWPFRDYVINSFNQDKPFDQLIVEHLAGDMIGEGDTDVEVGTAFLVCGPYDDVTNEDAVQAAQIRANTLDEIIRTTGEAFLGFTVGCSRCHDHKFDPISQEDYYQLYATFSAVRHGSRLVAPKDAKKEYEQEKRALEKKKQQLVDEKNVIEKKIVARGEANPEKYQDRWLRPAASAQGNEETFAPVTARHVRLKILSKQGNPRLGSGCMLQEFEIWTDEQEPRNVALATAGAKASGKARQARDFESAYAASLTIDGKYTARWIGYGSTLSITLEKPETINRVFFASDRTGDAQGSGRETAPCEYRIEVSTDGESWQEVANSLDRKPVNDAHRHIRFVRQEANPEDREEIAAIYKQISANDKLLGKPAPFPSWWLGSYQKSPEQQHIFIGGDPQHKGMEVHPASPHFLVKTTKPYGMPTDAFEGDRRLALARWLCGEDNPLTPRVLANRIWQYHFGTGIVNTPSDFGFMGGRPSHPELLDWLSGQLLKNNWQLKPLHKQIMLSQTYRQAGTQREEALKIDSDSRLLWRFPPRRLTSEEIRDTILSVAGVLNLKMGGTGFRLYDYLVDNVATYMPLDKHGPDTYRRSVYHQNVRAMQVDLISEFDAPQCAYPAPRRSNTTTPLQALALWNHSFTLDMAEQLSERLRQESETPDGQIEQAFQLAFSRSPAEKETVAARSLIKDHGLPAFCRAVLNANELIYID